ncbi:MAG TPA: DNA replication and repair protein RecF [Gemmatimonadaceae bacterium]|nr:DNA replication and repair protein RecF [Gemmatimonadaceae bacterium]
MTMAAPRAEASVRVWLRWLSIRDFRNLPRADLEIPMEGLVVVGENGHGKTNLLEAIYYLQLLRSIRGARDQDLVRFGAEGFHLAAEALGPGARELSVGFERAGRRKRVRLGGAEVPRLSDAIGELPAVMFAPRDVELVAGAPGARRRYLDVALALTSRSYLAALQHYRGALARRNAALRAVMRGARNDDRAAVWEPALARAGAVLWSERLAWVGRAAPRFAELCEAIGERAPVSIRYASAVEPGDGLEARLAAALASRRALDARRGITHAGPHRDELVLSLDGRELRAFGSAGQQRTASIALRILEAETLREASGGAPLFLLDDPFAELDARRSGRILELLAREGLGQVVLAVPRETDIPGGLGRLDRRRMTDGVLAPGAS